MSVIAEKIEARSDAHELVGGDESGLIAARVELVRAIHDGVVQDLFGIALTLDALAEQPGGDIRDCAERVRRVLTELRSILDEATPEPLPTRAADALPKLVDALREAARDVHLHVDLEAIRYAPAEVCAAVVNFATEGVRNARKHADCTYVAVRATLGSGLVCLLVENDGVRPARRDRGVGLRLLELDADRLGGFLTARLVEEKWQLILTLPIKHRT